MRSFGASILASPTQVVERAIALSAAHPTDLVSVAGPDGLAAMVALLRAGFERVECARQATCRGADEASDVLLIVGALSATELAALVARTARLLKDGGTLVVQLDRPAVDAPLRAALAATGFVAGPPVIDRACGCLAVRQVRRALPLRAAG
ncbi:hypothetical protein ACO2Q3_14385 [Caulobacter sp. KR2-114]|uniref:hypothetical protein n=1 Tax=Caulobacter sp. KR2-114 TaxID=3400912 RepID=UPI003BFB265E